MKRIIVLFLGALILGGAALGSRAGAATITQSDYFSVGNTAVPNEFFFRGFDSSRGTLNKVTLSFTGSSSISGHFEPNLDAQGNPVPFTYTWTPRQDLRLGDLSFTSPATFKPVTGAATGIGDAADEFHLEHPSFSMEFTFDELSNTTRLGLRTSASGVDFIPPTAVLGTLDYFSFMAEIDRFVYLVYWGGSEIVAPTEVNYMDSADGILTLTYDYAPVPEPSTFLLAGMGIVAAALVRRRINK